MPDVPISSSSTSGDDAANTAATFEASDAVPRSRSQRRRVKKARRSKFRRWTTRSVLALVLVVVAFLGAVVGITIYRVDEIGRVHVNNLVTSTKGIEDILLVGSTSRCAVKPARNFEIYVKQCEEGINGVNGDVIMILRLNSNDDHVSLLSIPRDTFVPDARVGGLYNRIDSALADGPSQLVRAIEQDFGIPINHYVVLNFESFADIVNALGGVDMYFPTQIKDMSGITQMKTGCQHIGGIEALALVRARHLYYNYSYKTKTWLGYDGSGDLGRIERDHIFLKVLAASVASHGLGNPVTDESLLAAIAPQLTVDTTFGVGEMLHLVNTFHAVGIGSVPEYTAPVVIDTQTYMYKGYNYYDVVFPTEPQDEQTIDAFMGTSPPGLNLQPSGITVSVVDGTGSATATATVVASLHALGYRVVATGSETPVGPISETTIRYATSSHLQDAEKVLSAVSGTVSLAQAATLGGADVTIVTGSDLTVASVHPARTSHPTSTTPTSTTTTMTPSTTTTMTPSTTSGVLDPPTAATSSIPSYDPRACPTSNAK